MSKIEWTEKTWNPITGCDKVSPGCKHCYAETMSKRLAGMGLLKYVNEFEVTLHPSALQEPLKRKTPTTYFVCSMSDLFHEKVPDWFIQNVFATMEEAPQHRYQVLTKRPERMVEWGPRFPYGVWLGTSVENREHGLPRIEFLNLMYRPHNAIKWLSIEPLLEDLGEIDLGGIDWVVIGGESGKQARQMNPEWVRNIVRQCRKSSIPVFVKQMGSCFGNQHHDIERFPKDLQIREYPR